VNPISLGRYWRMVKLNEEVVPVSTGYGILIRVHGHLKKLPPSEADNKAMAQIISIIGSLEDEGKALCQESADLWRAILELESVELSSPEIERARATAALGEEWITRIIRQIERNWPVDEGRHEILREISELYVPIWREQSTLGALQREYQMAQAEMLATAAELGVAEIFVGWDGHAN
jgi:hypothetical protein